MISYFLLFLCCSSKLLFNAYNFSISVVMAGLWMDSVVYIIEYFTEQHIVNVIKGEIYVIIFRCVSL